MKVWKVFSRTLEQELTITQYDNGEYRVKAADGVVYDGMECHLIINAMESTRALSIAQGVHRLKKYFDGKLLEIK